MGAPTTLPSDFFEHDTTPPETLPGNHFDKEASPSVPPHVPADPRKLTQGVIYSKTLGIPPALAYQQGDEIEKQMKDRGAGTIQDIANDIKVGGENSILGLAARHKLPHSLQNPTFFNDFVSDLSTMISDLPFYLGGAYLGGVAGGGGGAVAGEGAGAIPGAVAGGAMGTFAIPAMIRKVLVDGIQKGEVKSFGDYINRFVDMAVEGQKGAITGGAMEISGAGTLPALGKGAMAIMARKAQQVAAISILPKVMEGEMPTAKDFGVNAALVGALHLLTGGGEMETEKAKQGLMDNYSKDGIHPQEAATKLQAQPPVLADMEPGLRPAIQATRAIGTKGHVAAEEGETHTDVAERMFGEKPVTMDALESASKVAPETPREENEFPGPPVPEFVYQGVRKGNLKGEQGASTYLTRDINTARAFGGREGKGGVIRKYRVSDLPAENWQDYEGNRITPEEYFRTIGRTLTYSGLSNLKPVEEIPTEKPSPQQRLADKVLVRPEGHSQEVIDRALQLKKEAGEEVPEAKSGRGFETPDGKFISRERAKSWVKKNEPEVYEKWAEVTEDPKAEFHSADYAEARSRVKNQTMASGDPDVAPWSPELSRFLAKNRAGLNEVKAGDKSVGYGKAVVRDLFVGPRNMLRAQAEQLRGNLKNLIPDHIDQEALTFLRDYKGAPDELRAAIEEIRKGKNEKLKAYIPSMERALAPSPELLQADQQMTGYFTQALGLGRQVGTLESSIDPERYSPRLFMKAMEEGEDARREGRGKFTPRTPNAIRREYLRILDPLKSGDFEARTFNALDELSVYGDRHATAIATSLFKTELKNTELGKNGSREDVPSDWKELPGTHKSIVTKDTKTGETKSFQNGFYIPPVVADAMAPILEKNILSQYPLFRQLRHAQAYIKAAELGMSVFHMKAMSIMGWSNLKLTDFVKTLRSDNSSPEFQAGEREAALWGVETTMTGTPYEAYRGLKPSSVPSRLDVIRGKPGLKQIDELAQAFTHATFDVVQRKFKVMDFSLKQAAWISKHPEATDAEHGEAMRGLAKEVNAVYGGLNWDIMGWGPNFREGARALILAPDWTFSNFANLKYTMEGGPGGKAARAFWIKSTATGLALTAATSLLYTRKLSPHPTEVFLGKDKQGKEVYSNIFFAGAPRDFITWMSRVQKDGGVTGTINFMSYKAAPLVGIGMSLKANRDWTGRPITTPKEGTLERTGRQVLFAGEEAAPAPFTIKDLIEGMMNNSEQDYSYKDFLLGIAGATTRHEKPQGSKGRRKFSLTGK